MDRPSYYRYSTQQPQSTSDPLRTTATYTIYAILAAYAIHQLLLYYDYPVLPPQEIFWNALVYVIPTQLLLDRARRQELKANGMLSQTHAAKSEALRRVLGIGGNTVLQNLPGPAEGIVRRMSGVGRRPAVSDAPPGLGNWDNSCYQNSVLQGLASLESLKRYLGARTSDDEEGEGTTTETLREFVGRLNDESNNGRHLWTPAPLKNMSSWQQQDAQEYYSKVLDELDKESTKAAKGKEAKPGLESVVEEKKEEGQTAESKANKNPLDGLLAQRVACTKCGYSEGLSMIPFNCLTLPLGSSQLAYPLEECLDEYTKLEKISDVECGKCTLLRAEQQLTRILPPPPNYRAVDAEPPVDSSTLALPPELRAQAFQRLSKMQHALDEDDFADKTLHETCQIPKKARVSSTKTRQAVIGRAPQSLAIHVNRSVFDEMTGIQRKNYAGVRWPATLDLSSWVLPTDASEDLGPTDSLLADGTTESKKVDAGLLYRIKAVVTHYGRHENGHYICYRQYPTRVPVKEELDDVDEDGDNAGKDDEVVEMKWWRLSDEDVTAVSGEEVQQQGGVFMLFYEREQMAELPEPATNIDAIAARVKDAAATSIAPAKPEQDVAPTASVAESEHNAAAEIVIPEPSRAASSLVGTEPSSTNPTTPASVTTDATSPSDKEGADEGGLSTEATTEDELEVEPPMTPQTTAKSPAPPTSPVMRTARSQRPESPTNKDGGFGVGAGGFRPMATT